MGGCLQAAKKQEPMSYEKFLSHHPLGFEQEKFPKIVRRPSKSGVFGGKRPNTVINIHDINNDYYVHPSCPWSPEYQWQHK